jgi:hypothetical protein
MSWKNILQPDRPHMTIWRVRIACWITTAIHTHTHARARTHAHAHTLGTFITLLFYRNNGCTNAPKCYVIRNLLVVFNIQYTATDRHNVMWNRIQLAA